MKRIFAIATIVTLLSLCASAQSTDQQQQQQQGSNTTGVFTATAKPITSTSTKKVPYYTRAKARKPLGYRTVTTEKVEGYDIVAQIDLSGMAQQQQQQQMQVTSGPDPAFRQYVVQNEANIRMLDEKNQEQDGRIGNLEGYRVQNDRNIASLDRKNREQDADIDAVNERAKSANTKANWGIVLGIANLAWNGIQQYQISKNNGNRNYHGGGSGGQWCQKGMLWDNNQKRCYNQSVGGNCYNRGNCNYNTNPNGGGPISVGNCPPGRRCNTTAYNTGYYSNGNTYNSGYNNGGYGYNNGYSYNNGYTYSNNGYNSGNSGSNGYNTPRQNRNGSGGRY